jgi:hypothetical protein
MMLRHKEVRQRLGTLKWAGFPTSFSLPLGVGGLGYPAKGAEGCERVSPDYGEAQGLRIGYKFMKIQ